MTSAKWVPANKIQEIFEVSEDWLRSRRRKWKYGKHFIDISDGVKPHYLYNRKEIEAFLLTPPAQRP
jgi:hypothetical protein